MILKMITQRSTKHQVLISLALTTTEIVVANTTSTVEFYNKSLVSARSKLIIEFVYKI